VFNDFSATHKSAGGNKRGVAPKNEEGNGRREETSIHFCPGLEKKNPATSRRGIEKKRGPGHRAAKGAKVPSGQRPNQGGGDVKEKKKGIGGTYSPPHHWFRLPRVDETAKIRKGVSARTKKHRRFEFAKRLPRQRRERQANGRTPAKGDGTNQDGNQNLPYDGGHQHIH